MRTSLYGVSACCVDARFEIFSLSLPLSLTHSCSWAQPT